MANAKKMKRILLSAHEKFWNFNENIGISTINMIEKSKHNISISSTGISSKLGINAKLAKKIAFGIVDMRRDNPFHLVLAISAVSVAFMCPCMSFAATVLIKHAPASQIIPTWLQTTAMNFPMAFFWQIFYAGPFVRFIFGKLFPEKEKAAASAE